MGWPSEGRVSWTMALKNIITLFIFTLFCLCCSNSNVQSNSKFDRPTIWHSYSEKKRLAKIFSHNCFVWGKKLLNKHQLKFAPHLSSGSFCCCFDFNQEGYIQLIKSESILHKNILQKISFELSIHPKNPENMHHGFHKKY